jgi:hypothetical protein
MQVILQHIRSEPVPPSVRLGRPMPAALERLVLRCLAKRAADRPPDAAALAEALCGAGADEWTQDDARRWWETTFTPAPAAERPAGSATTMLEVTGGRSAASR